MRRLFVALDMPEGVAERLSAIQGGVQGARWVDPDNFHLTLRFIGEVDGRTEQDIVDALSGLRCPGFELCLSGIGHFETKGRIRALWAGVEPSQPLINLQRRVEQLVASAGVPAEGRKFRPHVTLARMNGISEMEISQFMGMHGLFRTEPFTVESVTLFESKLGREGPTYLPQMEVPLSLPLVPAG